MLKEYKTVTEVVGPLMLVEGVEGGSNEELVDIELQTGERRRGRVIEIDKNNPMVQLFEGSSGINLKATSVRLLGRPLELGVSEDMIGRSFNGLGVAIDVGPDIIVEDKSDVDGTAINAVGSKYPA